MILNYKDSNTKKVHKGIETGHFKGLDHIFAEEVMNLLEIANEVSDLNHLVGRPVYELGGARSGQRSIDVNGLWHIAFTPTPRGFTNVEIIKYDMEFAQSSESSHLH